MKRILILLMLFLVISTSTIAGDIVVKENVKLGGIVVSAQDYKLIYTGWDMESLYFEVIEGDIQYSMIVPEAMNISYFDLDVGVRIRIKDIDKYCTLKVERLE